MAVAGKTILVHLPHDLLVDVKAFCEAHMGAPVSRVVREALRHFIDARLETEPAVRERFSEARTRLRGPGVEPIRLVGSDTKRGR